jgi:hypothetical protein
VNTQMVRLYGHGPRGVRLVDHVPFGNRKTFTFATPCARRTHRQLAADVVRDASPSVRSLPCPGRRQAVSAARLKPGRTPERYP